MVRGQSKHPSIRAGLAIQEVEECPELAIDAQQRVELLPAQRSICMPYPIQLRQRDREEIRIGVAAEAERPHHRRREVERRRVEHWGEGEPIPELALRSLGGESMREVRVHLV